MTERLELVEAIRQAFLAGWEEGQEEVSQCCGCSGSDPERAWGRYLADLDMGGEW